MPNIEKFLRKFLLYNLRNFEKLLIFKFDNSKILLKFWQFRKLSNFHYWNFFLNLQNLLIKKNFKNPKNINFRKFLKIGALKLKKKTKIWVLK